MFGNKHTSEGTIGTVVAYRKAAVDAYLTVDTGSGNMIDAVLTRPRFDTLGIHNGTRVLISTDGTVIGLSS